MLALFFLAWPVAAEQPWAVLKDCRLLPNESNDGDSFHVSAGGREYIFRLYFVDAAETDESIAGRVGEQARYFRLNTAQTLQAGELAKQFTAEKLSRPFVVRTCLQDARGRSALPRYYAFIGAAEGDLGELLVANGLARVYGQGAVPVGLSSPQVEWEKLQRLERDAQTQKLGVWGAAGGRMSARAAKPITPAGADSFDAWFHPAQPATIATAAPTPLSAPSAWPFPTRSAPSSTPLAVTQPGKLDPNRATAQELLAISGIGPVLAERIIASRPFKSADELRRVKGIGPKKYEEIRPAFGAASP